RDETFRMMVSTARRLEMARRVTFDPWTFRTILETGTALYPLHALPGMALDMLERLAVENDADEDDDATDIDGDVLSGHLTARTGLPAWLMWGSGTVRLDQIESWLSQRVMGQPEAIQAAVDLVMRMRTGLADARRPFGVYLFTGPTGTGKTELAKALAEYLFSSSGRLLRPALTE